MLTRVERALGDNDPRAKLSATVDVVVARRTSGYRAVLRMRDQERTGERTLEHAQCDMLADSVALVIALTASDTDDTSASGAPLVLAVSAHGVATVGPLPQPAIGAGVSAALEGPLSLRWELSGSYYARQSASYPQIHVGASFRMLRFAARGCRVWSVGQLDLAPCLGAAVYRVDGQGIGGLPKRGGSFVWGPELSLLVRLRIAGHFALQLSGGAALALSRQRFTYRDLGLLHQPAALAYQLLIAPEVLF